MKIRSGNGRTLFRVIPTGDAVRNFPQVKAK